MSDARAEAVGAAVYVEVLSARGGFSIPDDLTIDAVAECLSKPTRARIQLAVEAADAAVARLRRELG